MEMVGWFLDQTKMVDPKVRTFNKLYLSFLMR